MKKIITQKNILILFSAVLTAFEFFSIYKNFNQSIGIFCFLLLPVLFLLNFAFIKFFLEEHRGIKNKWKIVLEIVLLFVFGSFLIKSFIIYIYPFARMGKAVAAAYGFGWSLFGMAVTYLLKHFLLKVNWQGKVCSKKELLIFLKFCIPSVIILGAVFIIYYPGVGTVDTVYIWDQIHANNYTDTHPLMFLMLYKGLSLVWDNIAVITLFQFILCILGFGYTAYYFSTKGMKPLIGWIIAVALPLLPINAFYSVMLWKDIPYSIGLLVYIILTIKVLEDNFLDKNINILYLILTGLLVMFMRHNGFIPVLGTVGLIWFYNLINKNFKNVIKITIIGVALVVLFYGTKTGVGMLLDKKESAAEEAAAAESVSYDNKTIIPSVFPTTIAMQQLIYIENYYSDTFTQEQKEKFALYLKVDEVEAHKFKYRMGNKYGPNWEFYHKPYLTQRGILIPDLPAFWNYYYEICRQHPITALESYQKLTGIIWASVGYGPTALRGYGYDNFTQYVGAEYSQFMSPAREFLDNLVFKVYSGAFIVFSRPAFYLMVILIFCFVGYKRHKWKYIISMSPVFLNVAGYLVVITAQDVRYFFINMLAFIVAIFYATMKSEHETEKNTNIKTNVL